MGALPIEPVPITDLTVSVYAVPTASPEADGTSTWNATTLVIVEASAGGQRGLGYTYADRATAELVHDTLSGVVRGRDALAIASVHAAMDAAVRYVGKPGIASLAISAVDGALWDLKARLLGLPLVTLLGEVRDRVDVYASGGFTSYSLERLCAQLAGWAEDGMKRVMMKVGRDPAADLARVRAARQAIGDGVELFVDAGGAYTRKQAIRQAARFAELGVTWFEQPVTEGDLEGLRFVRERVPMDVAPGEHGSTLARFREILEAGAVDVLQADGSRCGGITGFTKVGSLCDARSLRLSSCSAPALHLHACCAVPAVCHMEYFYDHARIERMLFDGALEPRGGVLSPDRTRPGFGIELKRKNAARYAA